jgi:ABC-type Zn uptake system ZnuABC Zn-binding protein ZnuA
MISMQRTAGWGLLGAVVAIIAAGIGGCSHAPDPWPEHAGKRIMVSFPPLYSFVTSVAGEDATVQCLLTTTGPHDYHATPADGMRLKGADLLVINGLGLDDFCLKLRTNSGNSKLKRPEGLLIAGDCIPTGQRKQNEKIDHGDHFHPGGYDPHVWLGIPQAILMVQAIRDRLKEIDPAHAANYDRRAAAYTARLEELHAEGRKKLEGKQERQLISFHDSLQYFAQSFGLKIAGVVELTAGKEASPAQIAHLVELCQKEQVRLIAVEPQYPQNTSARTLLIELGKKGIKEAAFVEVDPMETAPPEELSPDFYEKKMRANIKNLARALK